MRLVGMLRVKNESAWIERVIRSILPVCEHVYVLDDHSTDATPEICSGFDQVTVFDSPFAGLDETRDKTFLLNQMRRCGVQYGDYILAIDGDEELEQSGPRRLEKLLSGNPSNAYHLRVLYLWNDARTVRMDGVYSAFYRPSLFRFIPGDCEYRSTNAHGNLHCTNIPANLIPRSVPTDISLLHWGYVSPEIRQRKFEYYRQIDPDNEREDGYRHIVIGDIYPADSRFRYGGPLRLEPLDRVVE